MLYKHKIVSHKTKNMINNSKNDRCLGQKTIKHNRVNQKMIDNWVKKQ